MIEKEEFRKFAVHDQGISGSNVDRYSKLVENMTRSVIEERPGRFAEIDVFSRLIMDRIIFLGMQVDDIISNIIIAQLLFLESADPKKDVLLYINSPGGSVMAGLGIYDTMQHVSPDISTICTGMAASMGAVLLTGGADKKRAALPHSRVMIHQPSGGMQGTSADMEISLNLIMKLKEEIYGIISKHSGKSVKDIEKDSDRDKWMTADEAKDYGLIDEVLIKTKSK